MHSKDKPTADSAVDLDESVLDGVHGGWDRDKGGIIRTAAENPKELQANAGSMGKAERN